MPKSPCLHLWAHSGIIITGACIFDGAGKAYFLLWKFSRTIVKCHKLIGHLMQMQLMISSMALDQFRYYHVTLTAMYHFFHRTVLSHIVLFSYYYHEMLRHISSKAIC